MRLLSLTTTINIFLLLIGIIILPLCGLVIYIQINKLIEANSWVIHTEQVMNLSNASLLNLTDAESRINYYIITNDKSVVQDLPNLFSEAETKIKLLKSATMDNPSQLAKVNVFEKLAKDKMKLLTELAKVDNIQNNKKAKELATNKQRKEIKQETIRLINAINQQEIDLLEHRNGMVLHNIKRSHRLMFLLGIISEIFIILSLIFFNYLLFQRNRAIKKQTEAEKRLSLINKQLQESDERYLLATEGSAAGLWDWEVGTNNVFYSSYFKKMLGYSETEFPNTIESFEKAIHPNDHDHVWELVAEHIENHTPFKMEYRLKTKSGEYKWVEVAGQALWDSTGKATRMSGSAIDITERKSIQQRLRVQYAVIEILSESSTLEGAALKILKEICKGLGCELACIWTLDKEKNTLTAAGVWHESSAAMAGHVATLCQQEYKMGEGLPGYVLKVKKPVLISDIYKEKGVTCIGSAKELGLKSAFAFPILAQDKVIGVIEAFSYETKILDKLKINLMATIGIQLGQFLLKTQSDEALQKNEAYQTAILASVTDSILTVDKNDRILSFNARTNKEFDYAKEELEGQILDVLVPNFSKNKFDFVEKQTIETLGLKKNGETFPIEIKMSQLQIEDEILFVIVISNITERKKVERLKNEFISVVSHELRTPLTSIRGAIGLILGGTAGDYSEKMKKLLMLANDNSERLLTLINDILDIEKIEAGKMNFQLEVVNLGDLVKEAVNSNELFAKKYNIKLQLDTIDNVEVNADPSRLTQVITNLISNAVKFSPTGETVRVAVTRHQGETRVAVTNKGAGIPLEFQSKIFQKFSQVDSSSTRGKEGTGLGLNISKSIIEKLHGSINFVSEPGVETTFYFTLPIWGASKESIKETQVASDKPRVLICEDDEMQAQYLARLLEAAGLETDISYSAQEARHFLQKRTYHVLLLDLILPDQDGIAFIRELKKSEKTQALPIIVLSVIAQTGKSLLNGEAFAVIDWLDKPIDFEKLMHSIHRIKDKLHPKKPLILHVEDDEKILEMIKSVINDHADVISSMTIKETKEKLAQYDFDLLILDLLLPDGNAENLLPIISKKNIPVIIYSAVELDKKMPEIVKHVLLKSETSPDQLLQLVKRML